MADGLLRGVAVGLAIALGRDVVVALAWPVGLDVAMEGGDGSCPQAAASITTAMSVAATREREERNPRSPEWCGGRKTFGEPTWVRKMLSA